MTSVVTAMLSLTFALCSSVTKAPSVVFCTVMRGCSGSMGHSFKCFGVGEFRFYRHGVARPFSVRSSSSLRRGLPGRCFAVPAGPSFFERIEREMLESVRAQIEVLDRVRGLVVDRPRVRAIAKAVR